MLDWMGSYRGEGAALLTAWCWVFTSLSFAAAGRRVGPMVVNISRLFLAVAFLALISRQVNGVWIPTVDSVGLWWLILSGVIGLSIGDQLLFTALVDVGSRTSTLLMTLAPPIVALTAWFALNEQPTLMMAVGMAITLGGIAWVIRERPARDDGTAHPHWRRGLLLGIGAAWCQGIGFVIAKLGMGHTRLPEAEHVDPLSATLIRMAFAAVGMAVIAVIWHGVRAAIRQAGEHRSHRRRQRRWGSSIPFILMGTMLGPVLGVWCSLIAADASNVGIAATLMAMTPIFILPFAALAERERITSKAVIGAIVAVLGVVVLSLFGEAKPETDGEHPDDVTTVSVTDAESPAVPDGGADDKPQG
ncbi:MAG: DMT family transporter [Planctomycetota bacterium]